MKILFNLILPLNLASARLHVYSKNDRHTLEGKGKGKVKGKGKEKQRMKRYCRVVGAVDCDDGISCTVDECNSYTGCVSTPQDSTCDDGLGCTADICSTTLGCVHITDDSLCDDNHICTIDTCEVGVGCKNTPHPQFQFKQFNIISAGASDWTISSTTEARDLDGNVYQTGIITVGSRTYNVDKYAEGMVDRVDMHKFGGGWANTFPGGFGGAHFLVSVSAKVTIPAGTWTMIIGSDDGRILQMKGILFEQVSGQNILSDGGVGAGTPRIGYEYATAHAYSKGMFTVADETTVDLYAMFWKAGGGESFDLGIAPGDSLSSPKSYFSFLEDGVYGWKVGAC